ncbi:MAG: hypothetical protein R6X06_02405 [Gammaproteobacteria bacterium]
MLRLIRYTAILSLALSLVACGSNMMKATDAQQITPPSKGMAKIVFMRSSFVASAISSEIVEVKDGDLSLVGVLPNGNKIAFETTPGKKTFMAYGTAADFMSADVRAGMIYYVIVRPNWGTGGFAPTPVRADGSSEYNTRSADFKDWRDGTTLIEQKPEAMTWFQGKKADYQEIYKTYWERYQRKNPQELAERHLNPQDGVRF